MRTRSTPCVSTRRRNNPDTYGKDGSIHARWTNRTCGPQCATSSATPCARASCRTRWTSLGPAPRRIAETPLTVYYRGTFPRPASWTTGRSGFERRTKTMSHASAPQRAPDAPAAESSFSHNWKASSDEPCTHTNAGANQKQHPKTAAQKHLIRSLSLNFPNAARWASRDPIGISGGLNLYGYVKGDPMNVRDQLGLKPDDDLPTSPTRNAFYVCCRSAGDFPIPKFNHAAFWNPTGEFKRFAGTTQTSDGKYTLFFKTIKVCGMQGSSGSNSGSSGTTNEDQIKGAKCYLQPARDAKQIIATMSCCLRRANRGVWFPFVNDCHNAVRGCLYEGGFGQEKRVCPEGRIIHW